MQEQKTLEPHQLRMTIAQSLGDIISNTTLMRERRKTSNAIRFPRTSTLVQLVQ